MGRHGAGAGEGVRLVEVAIDGFAQRLTLEHRGRRRALRLPLVGEFQIENALVAAGLAIATGSQPDAVFAEIERLQGAKGRLEWVGSHNGAPVFVDYAHKPDALAKALQALRPYARRALVVGLGTETRFGTCARVMRSGSSVQVSGRKSRRPTITGTSRDARVTDTSDWQLHVLPSDEAY